MIAAICLAALVLRLWHLQVVYGSYYRDLSENNRTRAIRTAAPRGNIYDREGRVLVRNRPSFNIALMLEDTPNPPETVRKIAEITGRDPARLLAQFESRKGTRPFEPKVVMYDASRTELAKIKVQSHKLPGVIVTEIPTRAYTNDSLGAQLFGYSREVNRAQLELLREKGYKQGDIVGQAGLEKEFEDDLRGTAGYVQVEVDARGTRKGELGIVDARQGSDIYLTIDLDLQKTAEEALGNRRGAVVALDPRNGEVLVLASGPSFDANMFTGQMLASEWEQVAGDRDRPLTNRAISAVYPAGSTFKIVWSVAALAEKKVTPTTEFFCPGFVVLNGRTYHCHKHSGHGSVNLQKAIMVSCNAYFYQVGQLLNINRMTKYLELFGFGQLTGIELPGEEPGTAPSERWKQKVYGEKWYPGDTVPISIGQGYLVVTPIQMASMMATVANGGTRFKPMLIKRVENSLTGQKKEYQPVVAKKIEAREVSPDVFAKVREYAVDVVNDAHGTGSKAKLEQVRVAGKTGTAQVGILGRESLGERFRDHAWFIAFAPAEEPTIALAVIVENSGHGGTFAAPVAHNVLEKYFRKLGVIQDEPAPPVQEVKEAEGPPPEAVNTAETPGKKRT